VDCGLKGTICRAFTLMPPLVPFRIMFPTFVWPCSVGDRVLSRN
jgi:hypothetical protein